MIYIYIQFWSLRDDNRPHRSVCSEVPIKHKIIYVYICSMLLGVCWAHVGSMLGRVGPMLGHLGPKCAMLGPTFWAMLSPSLAT